MGTVSSVLSLLLMFAIVGGLIFLSRRSANARLSRLSHRTGLGGGQHPGVLFRAGSHQLTPLGHAFSLTLAATLFLVSGLIGYRLDKRTRIISELRWEKDVILWQVFLGLAMACAAAWFWRKGLHDLRSNVRVPELAGHDPAAPPSRRIERR